MFLAASLAQPGRAQFIQQGGKLVGTGVRGSGAFQGYSVAISSDGTTAPVGAPYDGSGNPPPGAVWVYTRANGVWS